MNTSLLAGGVLFATLLAPLSAQKDLEDKLDAFLAEEWLQNAAWTTDFEHAKKLSKQTGKKIFGYFTRSYAP